MPTLGTGQEQSVKGKIISQLKMKWIWLGKEEEDVLKRNQSWLDECKREKQTDMPGCRWARPLNRKDGDIFCMELDVLTRNWSGVNYLFRVATQKSGCSTTIGNTQTDRNKE
jgi:hypothetical protein